MCTVTENTQRFSFEISNNNTVVDRTPKESSFDGRILIVLDGRREGAYDLYPREVQASKPLSARSTQWLPSQKTINVVLCLLISAVSMVIIFAAFPPAIMLALKITTVAIGLISCANNNARSNERREQEESQDEKQSEYIKMNETMQEAQ